MDFTLLCGLLIVLLELVTGGEYCRDGYEVFYCEYGCCGGYYDEFCCGMYTWAIGAIVVGVILILAASVCVVCVICKKKNKNMVITTVDERTLDLTAK